MFCDFLSWYHHWQILVSSLEFLCLSAIWDLLGHTEVSCVGFKNCSSSLQLVHFLWNHGFCHYPFLEWHDLSTHDINLLLLFQWLLCDSISSWEWVDSICRQSSAFSTGLFSKPETAWYPILWYGCKSSNVCLFLQHSQFVSFCSVEGCHACLWYKSVFRHVSLWISLAPTFCFLVAGIYCFFLRNPSVQVVLPAET